MGEALTTAASWPFVPVLGRIGLAVGIGAFVGLEREHAGKAGVRTFTLVALLAALAGLSGTLLIGVTMGFVLVAVGFMNWRQMSLHRTLALTTSVALTVVAFCGVLCGQGHLFTPVAGGVITAALLAWKAPISGFVSGLTDRELRAAILLAILTCVVLPVLPARPVDPWGLIEPRSNWASVIIIAAIGFINYILLRMLGPRGMELTALFGGLVNSRKVIVELITRVRENGEALAAVAYRGVLLATGAMALRNALIVGILSPAAAARCVLPLGAMCLASVAFWQRSLEPRAPAAAPVLALESPFRLSAALQFGFVFLLLNVAGALAQRHFGSASFYFVSAAGGLISSASSIASAATLMSRQEVTLQTGINGIVLSSVTSILVNVPLVRRIAPDAAFARRIARALAIIAVAGLAGAALNELAFRN